MTKLFITCLLGCIAVKDISVVIKGFKNNIKSTRGYTVR